jgi:hypothetical protein
MILAVSRSIAGAGGKIGDGTQIHGLGGRLDRPLRSLREYDVSLRTNYAKEWMDVRKREGKIAIFPKEAPLIAGMARAGAHPMVKEGAFEGYVERSGFWRGPTTSSLSSRPTIQLAL